MDLRRIFWENKIIPNTILGVRMGRPTTVESSGKRLLPAVVAITLLLPLLFAGTALAADLHVTNSQLVLAWLLNRPPTSFKEFAVRMVSERKIK